MNFLINAETENITERQELTPLKMRLMSLPINRLKPIKINPAIRTEKTRLRTLREEILKTKIIVPLIVMLDEKDNQYSVIDGSRRYFICKDLKLAEIQCCIIEKARLGIPEIFVALNKQLKMDGYQRLIIMRDASIFFNKQEEKKYSYLVDIGGKNLIDVMIEKRNNASYTYYWLQLIIKYLGTIRKDEVARIAFWLVENKQQYQVRKALEAKISKSLLQKAIDKDQPLKGLILN